MTRMVGALTWLQIKMTLRNRQALFWNFAFPILLMAIMGWIFGNPDKPYAIGLIDRDRTPASQQVARSMKDSPLYTVHENDEPAELAALRQGDRLMVLILEPGFARRAAGEPSSLAGMRILYNGSIPAQASLVENIARAFTTQVSLALTGKGALPAGPVLESVTSHRIKYIDYLVPGIVVLMIMTANLMGVAVSLVAWRQQGILRHMGTTPLPRWAVIVARLIAGTMVNALQVSVAVAAGVLLFKADVLHHLGLAALYALIGCWSFMALAFAMAALVRTVDAVQPLSAMAVNVMMLLGGIMFRADQAPAWLQSATRILPVTYVVEGLRAAMTTPGPVSVGAATLIGPGIWFVLSFVVAVAGFRWE